MVYISKIACQLEYYTFLPNEPFVFYFHQVSRSWSSCYQAYSGMGIHLIGQCRNIVTLLHDKLE
jgi:hypothetical protein